MRVLEIELTNVMCHASSKLVLPAAGIVLITGRNGAGKSSLLEAVSVGAWEKPLRGKPVWGGERASIRLLVEAGTDKLLIQRSRTKSKTTLSFATAHGDQLGQTVQYENKTKAQEALEAIVGAHELWRRTHVFSSSDADGFTTATDAERKRMLESLLGLDRFDAASSAVRADLQVAVKTKLLAENAVELAKGRLEGAQQRVADLSAAAEEHAPVDTAKLDEELAALRAEIEELFEEQQELRRARRESENKLVEVKASRRAAEVGTKRAEGLVAEGCPTCGQSVPHAHLDRALAERARVEREANTTEAALTAELAELDKRSEKNARSVERRERRRADVAAARRMAREAAEAHARAQNALAAARRGVQEATAGLRAAEAAVEQARASWANLEAAAQVLSVGGVRSQLLGAVLGGIEGVANAWLAKIAGNMSLTLSPYAEKASGGVKDSISLDVEGAGNGHGYYAASGGQRRRIDIALMLALAEVAEASAGHGGGTIFCDEVFDALDEEGVDAVCAALDEISQTRCVVVISHSDAVKRRLRAVRYVVADGTVRLA